jgi:hypothetical protein
MAASLQAEVLYALLGYTGQVVVRLQDGSFGLVDGLALDPCERKLVLGMLPLGACYAALDDFLYTQLFDWRAASAAAGGRDPQVVALASGLEECLAPYHTRVLELEQQLLRGALPLTELHLGLSDYALTLPLMRSIVQRVQAEGAGAAPLLDLLAETAASAVDSGRECVEVLLWHVQRVFLSQLASWLLYGELLPAACSSFFIQRVAPAERDSGPSAAGPPSVSAAPAVPNEGGRGSATPEEGWEPEEGSSPQEGWGRSPQGWGEFETSGSLKPRLLPMRVAERALFIGKAVRVLRAAEASEGARGSVGKVSEGVRRRDGLRGYDGPGVGGDSKQGGCGSRGCGGARGCNNSQGGCDGPRGGGDTKQEHGGSRGCDGWAGRPSQRGATKTGSASQPRASASAAATLDSEAPVDVSGDNAEKVFWARGESIGGGSTGGGANESVSASAGARDARTQHIHSALGPFSDELASLRAARSLATALQIDEMIGRMAAVASRLLWRHLTHDCGLHRLFDAIKGFFLLGRGELFHRLVLELRGPMASLPSARLDLQAALQHAAAGAEGDSGDYFIRGAEVDAGGGGYTKHGAETDAGGYMKRLSLVLPAADRGQSAYTAWRKLGTYMASGRGRYT